MNLVHFSDNTVNSDTHFSEDNVNLTHVFKSRVDVETDFSDNTVNSETHNKNIFNRIEKN